MTTDHAPEPGAATAGGVDPAQYGRSFADVYDQWYPAGSAGAVVGFVRGLASPHAAVLELGIGTGRIALALAAAGLDVTGLDASADMIDVLRSKPGASSVAAVLGDAADRSAYPARTFDVVLAADNLLFNLTDDGAQQRCLAAAAASLAPRGALVVEAFVPRTLDRRERELVTRSVGVSEVTLIATDADPVTRLVHGSHIELRDGDVRLRPWTIRTASVAEIDRMADRAGLTLVERYEDFRRAPYVGGESTNHVSVYGLTGHAPGRNEGRP